jgi:hypothetical protein
LKNVAQKETVIVNGKAIPGVRIPIPQHAYTMFMLAKASSRYSDNLRFLSTKDNFPCKLSSCLPGWCSIDQYAVSQTRFTTYKDLQTAIYFLPMPSVQNRAMKWLLDF